LLTLLFLALFGSCVGAIIICLTSFWASTDPNKVLKPFKDETVGLNKSPPANFALSSVEKSGRNEAEPNWIYFGYLAEKDAASVYRALVGDYDKNMGGGYLFHMAQQWS
jgi:hypothetical protein